MIPTFIDFEASSLRVNSYPIEVAWNLEDGSIESHLISPASVVEWTDWDMEAQKVHKITKEELLRSGEPAVLVCGIAFEKLEGRIIYTDNTLYDGFWLRKLFSVCEKDETRVKLADLDTLLVSTMCPEPRGRGRALERMVRMKFEARKKVPGQHRAAWDVAYFLELWKLACRYRDEVDEASSI